MYQAYAASDAYVAGKQCDGHPFYAEAFYVVLENEAGRRFRHDVTFRGAEESYDPETGESVFLNLRYEAEAKAERLAERINAALAAGQKIKREYWREVDPAYGSDEYQRQGIELQRHYEDKLAA